MKDEAKFASLSPVGFLASPLSMLLALNESSTRHRFAIYYISLRGLSTWGRSPGWMHHHPHRSLITRTSSASNRHGWQVYSSGTGIGSMPAISMRCGRVTLWSLVSLSNSPCHTLSVPIVVQRRHLIHIFHIYNPKYLGDHHRIYNAASLSTNGLSDRIHDATTSPGMSLVTSRPRMCTLLLPFYRIGVYDTGVHAVPTVEVISVSAFEFWALFRRVSFLQFPRYSLHDSWSSRRLQKLESFDFGYAVIEGVIMYSVDFNRSTSDMRDFPLFFYSIISAHVFSSSLVRFRIQSSWWCITDIKVPISLIISFRKSTPHSCDADSNVTVPGELHNVYY